MLLELAPMEGITTAAYRQLHHQLFPGVDRYYTPFLVPNAQRKLTRVELREISPENNRGLTVVPQLLTRDPGDFLWGAAYLRDLGYEEVNLNAGCPSGTVTAKGKGSGMLGDPDQLRRFLDAVFAGAPCKISVKTRLGLREPSEFEEILQVYNDYPIACLTVHPRVRQDLYRHPVRMDWFDYAASHSKNPLSFNGGIVTLEDCRAIEARYPGLRAVMVGQALVSDPALARKYRGGAPAQAQELRQLHDRLLETYTALFDSRPNAIRRLKELWRYESRLFADSDRTYKKLLKTRTPEEYTLQVQQLLALPLLEQSRGGW